MRTLAALACAVVLMPGGARGSVVVAEAPVADYGNEQMDGHVSGDVVVYTDYAAGTADVIGLRSLEVPLAICTGPGDQSSADIDGDLVVCVDSSLGSRNLLVHELSTGLNGYLTDYAGDEFSPAISNLRIAFIATLSGVTSVRAVDIDLGTPYLISIGNGTEANVSIDGNLVAWQTVENGNQDVYAAYLGGPPFVVAGTASNEKFPSVSGGIVAYIVDNDVALFDTVSRETIRITNDPFIQKNVKISGDYVVWSDNRAGDYDIYLYERVSGMTYALRTGPGNQVVTDLDGATAVFNDDLYGSADVRLIRFRINHPPVADAGPDQNVYVGATVQLQGSATDPDSDAIASWSWTLVSGPSNSIAVLTSPTNSTTAFVPDLAGDYVVSLVTSDGIDQSVADVIVIHAAADLPPVAAILASATSGTAPLVVTFDGRSSVDPEGFPLTYSWSFGDYTPSDTGPVASHVYTNPGSYVAQLTVTDVKGQTDADTLAINVMPPANHAPVASPTATPVSGPAPLSVQFAANATDVDGDPLTYLWDFGDPTSAADTSTLASPSWVYRNAGTYVAWLTVSDGKASTSTSLTIVVSPEFDMSVLSASAKIREKKATADVQVEAKMAVAAPAPSDVIAVYFDGAPVVEKPFSAFVAEAKDPLAYVHKGPHVYAKIDLAAERLVVSNAFTKASALDSSNGVDIEVHVGDKVAIKKIAMVGDEKRIAYVAPPTLVIDQSQTITDRLGMSGGTLWGQTFVPSATNLAQVDLLFMEDYLPQEGMTSTVGLYREITQAPIATASATMMPLPPGVLEGIVSFRFDPPIPLQPGTPYTIGWLGPAVSPSGAVMSWEFTFQNAYASGLAVGYDGVAVNPPADFVFTTYYVQ